LDLAIDLVWLIEAMRTLFWSSAHIPIATTRTIPPTLLGHVMTEKPSIVVCNTLICVERLFRLLTRRYSGHLPMTSRREFIVQLSVGSTAFAVAQQAQAQAPMLAETDAQAKALGYVALGTKADKAKYPKYAADQQCSNCALFQGKAADAAAACPLFAGKQVAGKGWCSAWAKKA
jgi:hypothetical protein